MRDTVTADRLGRRPGEAEVARLSIRPVHSRRNQPEQAVHSRQGLVENRRIVVRAPNDLHADADRGVQAGRVADDHTDRILPFSRRART